MEQAIIRRIHHLCILAALVAVGLLVTATILDGKKEWKQYQKSYREILLKETDPQANPEFYSHVKGMKPEIRQIMVPEFDAVDRCVSCHMGIDDSLFVKARQPLRTHPNLVLLKQHPVENYGCTICHKGQGLATTQKGAGHKTLDYLPDSMFAPALLEARCGFCHKDFRNIGTLKLADGQQLFQDMHCLGCHKLGGVGGTLGTDLSFFADKGPEMFDYTYVEGEKTKQNWVIEHFRNPYQITPGTSMRIYGFSNYDTEALTTYLLSLTKRTFSAQYQPAPSVVSR